ncbi:MAG: glycosyltransferase family 4 protein [bacterium]|nr:glycosyltransferase family 4 protein [bacterium]
MKITCITPVFPPIRAGMARAAFEIARVLGEQAEVKVETPDTLKSWGRIGYGSFHPTIGRVLHDADIVLLHYPFFGAMEPLAFATLVPHRAKVVVWYHMDAVGTGITKSVFAAHRAIIAPWILKRADAIVFASRDYVATGPHADLILNKPHREIPFGVSEHFSASRLTMGGPVVFGFVGALDRQHAFKGVPILLDAFKKVENRARLVIVGDGDRRKEYEAKASSGVRFVGSVSDEQLVKLYELMDVLVLPSTDRSEAFGMVIAEAMACGVPAIVSDLPGVRGVIGPGDTCGVRVPAGDVNALARALQDVVDHPDIWCLRGSAAAAYATENYRWDRVAVELVRLFEMVRQR